MCNKSGLAADSRWQRAMNRCDSIIKAMSVAKIYSQEWYDLREQLNQQQRIAASCTVATSEAFKLHHTSEGDFTHLHVVGCVSFSRGTCYAH